MARTMPTRAGSRPDGGVTLNRGLLLGGAVLVVALLAYRQYDRFANPRVDVWVSTAALTKGQRVTDTQLVQVRLPRPKGALVRREDIAGRELAVGKQAGQPFYPADLVANVSDDAGLAASVPPGRVLATVRVSAFDLPVSQLENGDRIDILQASGDGAVAVARNAQVMGRMGAPTAALILAVRPDDVVPLARAQGTRGALKMVLYSASDVRAGQLPDTMPANSSTPTATPATHPVELIHGTKTETVNVR